MASNRICTGLILALVAMLCGRAVAQSGCINVLPSLAPCLNYITGNSMNPSSSCCSQLKSVVQASPQCLCSVVNGGGFTMGIPINQTLAQSLPGACNVQTPPVSQCKAAIAPTTSSAPPVNSPTSSPSLEPTVTPPASVVPSASGSRSKSVPSTNGTSDGKALKTPIHFILFLLFVAWYGSTANKF